MKTYPALLSVVFALVGSQAHAVDFTGHWTGKGTMTIADPYTGNHVSDCSLVDVTLEHVPALLTIKRYHAICGQMDSDWGPHDMEIRGTDIYEDGDKTGTLEGDTLLTDQPTSGGEYAFNLRLKTPEAGQAPVLETYYGVKSLVGAIVIEGNLSLASKQF